MPIYRVSNGSGVTPRSVKPQAEISMNSARQAPRSSQDWRGDCVCCPAKYMLDLISLRR